MSKEEEWVVANIPRVMHENVKEYSEKTGRKMKDIYSAVMKLGWSQFKESDDDARFFENIKVNKSEIKKTDPDEVGKDSDIFELVNNLNEQIRKLSEIAEKNQKRIEELSGEEDETDVDLYMDEEATEEPLVEKEDELEEGVEIPEDEEQKEDLDETEKIDFKEKFLEFEGEIPAPLFETLDDLRRYDFDDDHHVGNIEKIKYETVKALSWLTENERGTKPDIVEGAEISQTDWKNYALRGLRKVSERTEKENKHVIVNPGTSGTWWWYVEDLDDVEYWDDDIELEDDIIKRVGETGSGKSSKNCYIGFGDDYGFPEEVLRVIKYIKKVGKTKKSEIVKDLYTPYINMKETSWYKKMSDQGLNFIEGAVGYIKTGHTIEWTGEPKEDQ